MAQYRSARGKVVDMGALASKNERVRAVGNMSVNARGDTIDSQGNIVVPATKKAANNYQKTVGNRAANVVKPDQVQNRLIPDTPVNSTQPDTASVVEVVEPIHALEEEFDAGFTKEELKQEDFVIKPASEAPQFFKPEPKSKK
jgi:hypothetical protein